MREHRVFVTVRLNILLVALLLALNLRRAAAQSISEYVPVSTACVELSQTVREQVKNGRLEEGEKTLFAAMAERPDPLCGGLILTNMAAVMAVSGRLEEAVRFAEKAIGIMEKSFATDDRLLLNPLQIISGARYEQGQIAKAREAFERMRRIPIDRPQDVAMVHGMAGVFLQDEGRFQEAEAEYLAAVHAWERAGRAEMSDTGAVLASLASVYIRERRFDEAQRALARATTIFEHASDTVPMDRVKLLSVRAGLHARQGDWQKAELDLRDALSLADREAQVIPLASEFLLTNYARVLRKNHRGREARAIEARAAALGAGRARGAVVDVSELFAKPKPAKK